jgi:hypothetical protein
LVLYRQGKADMRPRISAVHGPLTLQSRDSVLRIRGPDALSREALLNLSHLVIYELRRGTQRYGSQGPALLISET